MSNLSNMKDNALANEVMGQLGRPDVPLERLLPWEDIFHHAFDSVILINREQQIVYASPETERLFLYKPAELLNQPLDILIPDEYVERHREHVRRFYQANELARPMSRKVRVIEGKRKDKTIFPAEAIIIKAVVQQDEEASLFMGVFLRDITERRQAFELRHKTAELEKSNAKLEQAKRAALSIMQDARLQRQRTEAALRELTKSKVALRETQIRLSLALKSANMGTWQYIVETDEFVIDETDEKIYGFEHGRTVSKADWAERIHPADRAHARQQFEEMLLTGREYEAEYRIIKPDGDVVYLLSKGKAYLNQQGEPISALGIDQDITELKQTEAKLAQAKEAADAANRAKGEFLANMSHEIRTPMNAVLGMAHLGLQADPDPKQQGYLKNIQHSAQRLLHIINDILDFSKIEAGKLEIVQEPFDLQGVLNHVETLINVRAEGRNLNIVFATAADVPTMLVGDSLRLEQVLINLVGNAVKFTEVGEIAISVERWQQNQADQIMLQFSVRDTGIGMAPEQLTHLFQAFSQGDSSMTRQYGGTGLGLAISKQLVDMMGGEIWVESELGRGTTFTFTIPFGLPASSENRSHSEEGRLTNARILVVEDNEINQKIVKLLLERLGLLVQIAANGREALEVLQTDVFDAMLVDIQMPEMDGYQVAREIRASDAPYQKIPIIAMTAHAMKGDREKSLAAGMNEHITKPLNRQHLYELLAQWIDPKIKPDVTETAQTTHRQDNLQSLDTVGLDVGRGLTRIAGDTELYRRVLREFSANQGDVVAGMRAALAAGKISAAGQLAHSLKGTAGNIGAEKLQEAAEALEMAFKREAEVQIIDERLSQVATQMEIILRDISWPTTVENRASDQVDVLSGDIESAEFVHQIQTLAHLLKYNDTAAVEMIHTLYDQLGTASQREAFTPLVTLLEAYQFEEALDSLSTIARQWNIKL